MANKLLNFESFHEWQSIIEKTKTDLENAYPINEAFSSSILRNLTNQESGGRWQKGLAGDMNKKWNLAMDKITNEDFIILSSGEEYWQQGWAKKSDVIGFLVDDNPELFKEEKFRRIAKGAKEVGLLLAIVRGKYAMYSGLDIESGWGRNKKSSSDRYGVLADKWKVDAAYGYNSSVMAKVTQKNMQEMATKVYVLDLAALREKYSTSVLVSKRKDAKAGALALTKPKDFKSENLSRYKQILQKKLTPDSMLDELNKSISKYQAWLSEKTSNIKFDPKAEAKEYFYKEMQVNWGGWSSDYSRPIENMLKTLNEFMREWNDYLRDAAKLEQDQKNYDEEVKKDPESKNASRLLAEIEYYGKSYDRFVSKIIQYRDTIRKYSKDVDTITSK